MAGRWSRGGGFTRQGSRLLFLAEGQPGAWLPRHSFSDFGPNARPGVPGGGGTTGPRKIFEAFCMGMGNIWAWVGQNTDPPGGGVVGGWVGQALAGRGPEVPGSVKRSLQGTQVERRVNQFEVWVR